VDHPSTTAISASSYMPGFGLIFSYPRVRYLFGAHTGLSRVVIQSTYTKRDRTNLVYFQIQAFCSISAQYCVLGVFENTREYTYALGIHPSISVKTPRQL
jgi:hypothetical protein